MKAVLGGAARWGGVLGAYLTANPVESAATFRRGTKAKVSFVLLHVADLLLTVAAINHGLNELNPIMQYLLTVPLLMVLLKFVVPVVIAWLAPGKLLLPSILLLGMLLAWNVKEFIVFVV